MIKVETCHLAYYKVLSFISLTTTVSSHTPTYACNTKLCEQRKQKNIYNKYFGNGHLGLKPRIGKNEWNQEQPILTQFGRKINKIHFTCYQEWHLWEKVTTGKLTFLLTRGIKRCEICCYQVKKIQGINSHDTYNKSYQQINLDFLPQNGNILFLECYVTFLCWNSR